MWTETSSFAGYTSTSESSNITKIPGVGNPALYMLQIPGQSTKEASISQGKQNHVLYICTDQNYNRRFLHYILTYYLSTLLHTYSKITCF